MLQTRNLKIGQTQQPTPLRHSPFMIGANGSVRGKKEFEPSSLAAESESLLGPHLEDYWSIRRQTLSAESVWRRSVLG